MAGDDAQERTHEPTDKRKQKFREKGEVPRSKEVTSTIGLVIATIVLVMTMQAMLHGVREVYPEDCICMGFS